MKRLLLVALAVIFLLPFVSIATPVSAEVPSKYVIQAKLNFERAFLDIQETVTYTNRAPKALSSVVFNVTPAHFRAFKLKSATVDGVAVDPRLDGVVMELPLPKPLGQRDSTTIELEFSLDVPQQGGRFGVDKGVFSLGNWYPVLAIYRDDWDRHRYNAFGDPFLTDVADYDVTLDITSAAKVAYSGELISHEGNTWHMKGTRLRDFALAVSDKWESRSVDVDGVTVTALYLPEHRPAGNMYIEAGSRSVKWLDDKLGTYPNKTLFIAETVSTMSEMVGQEYPGVVFISSSEADKAAGLTSYLAYLVAHEIVHQWFYAIVGSDQMYDPWLDEAMATYLGHQILGGAPLSLSSPSVAAAGNSPVNQSIYDFKDEGTYSATVYGKGAVFLQDLNAAMKSDNFYKMLRRYVEIYKDKIATPRDFLTLAQDFSPTSLNALIRKFFTYPEFKSDSAPKLEVKWPEQSTLTGTVEIPFETKSQVQQITVDADGRNLLTQDKPTSPITVMLSSLADDDYVLRVAIRDDKGAIAQQVRRVSIANPRPTPTPTKAQQSAQPASVPGEIAQQVGGLTQSLPQADWLSYLSYSMIAIGALALLVLLAAMLKHFARPGVKLDYPPKLKQKYAPAEKSLRTKTGEPPAASAAMTPTASAARAPMANIDVVPIPFKGDGFGKYGVAELEELEAWGDGDGPAPRHSRPSSKPRKSQGKDANSTPPQTNTN
ncbi:MAG: M1 family metallopeptidase [Dehalococcoidales bacterium]|nr:M1 family metallopeptidase [Dehalococcoidales bacterium]